MRDPTLQEMREFVSLEFPDAEDIDAEAAIYWFAADYHGGQATGLYGALSASGYGPGASERGPGDGMAGEIFDALEVEYGKD